MTTNIVLMGAPGSGKGTFSEFLTRNDNYFHLCLGDILRKEMQDQTPLGLECKSFVDAGKLVPTSTGIKVFEQYYAHAQSLNKFVIVDGMVQNEEYANYFKEKFADQKAVYVFLNAAKELCIERLTTRKVCKSCAKVYALQTVECCKVLLEKRVDDTNQEAIERRVNRFFNTGIHLVECYKYVNLIEIDANQTIELLTDEYRKLFITQRASL